MKAHIGCTAYLSTFLTDKEGVNRWCDIYFVPCGYREYENLRVVYKIGVGDSQEEFEPEVIDYAIQNEIEWREPPRKDLNGN